MVSFMKNEKNFFKFKIENKIEAVQLIGVNKANGDNGVCLAKTEIKYEEHEVLIATRKNYYLFVYNDKDDFNDRKNWEIFDKGNCYGKKGIIKQWEIMKILNSGLNG